MRHQRSNTIEVTQKTPFIIIVTQYVSALATQRGDSPLALGSLASGASCADCGAAMASFPLRYLRHPAGNAPPLFTRADGACVEVA